MFSKSIRTGRTFSFANIRENAFFMLYALYEVIYYFFGVSRINTFFDTSHLTFIVNLIVMIGLAGLIIIDQYTLKEITIVSIGMLFGLYAYAVIKLNVLLISVMFMAAAKHINLNRFVKKDFVLRSTLLGIIILANRVGWIPSVVGLREGTFTIVRDSLGFGQYNITGALVMICVLEYVYLNFSKLASLAYQIIGLVVIFTLVTTNSRGSMLAVVLYTVCSWFSQYHLLVFKTIVEKYKRFTQYLFGVLTVISIVVVVLFKYQSTFWQFVNRVTSDRVNILNQYYYQFGIHLLPQHVDKYRSAGAIVMDNIYVTLAIQYGVLILLLFVVIYWILCQRALHVGNIEFLLLIVALMIFGLIESTFFIIGVNFTIMMVFADVTPLKGHILGGDTE